jgi:hypothetical protein
LLRQRVWARFHQQADIPQETTKAAQLDTSIDDPAVSHLKFAFTPIRRAPEFPGQRQSIVREVKRAGDCTKDLRCVQSLAVR